MYGTQNINMTTEIFNQTILPITDRLFRLSKSILKDEERAKDALQDVLTKLWEKRAEMNHVHNPVAFSLQMMRNYCLNNIRDYHETEEISEDIVFIEADSHGKMEQKEAVKIIINFIEQLPELQRTVMHLRDVEGLEIKEIAQITSLSENAVTVNLSRARQQIRKKLITLNIKTA